MIACLLFLHEQVAILVIFFKKKSFTLVLLGFVSEHRIKWITTFSSLQEGDAATCIDPRLDWDGGIGPALCVSLKLIGFWSPAHIKPPLLNFLYL